MATVELSTSKASVTLDFFPLPCPGVAGVFASRPRPLAPPRPRPRLAAFLALEGVNPEVLSGVGAGIVVLFERLGSAFSKNSFACLLSCDKREKLVF